MAHLQESGRLSRSRCKLWIMSPVAFSHATSRNQKMGRCDLSTRSQIPMAHRQKQFQVKSSAKHWNSIASLRSGILEFPKKKQNKGCPLSKKTKTPMAHLQESGRLSRSRCKLWIMSLVAFSYARNQKMGRCDLSTWSQIPMAHRQKQFQVKSSAKHWNSITSLRSGISRGNKIKGVHSQKNKIPMAHFQESGRLSRSRCKLWIMFLAWI